MANTMTQKQIDLLSKLQVERDCTGVAEARLLSDLRAAWNQNKATKMMASGVINDLLKAPVSEQGRRHIQELDPGIYQTHDGKLIRVYLGQNSGRMLAKNIERGEDGSIRFMYLGIAKRYVPEDARRLSREEVGDANLAMDSTICLVCGIRLDDPESVQRGIGPVCFQNYGSV